MRLTMVLVAALGLAGVCFAGEEAKAEEGWIPLFDGKTLDGWKPSEAPDSFKVEDGAIVVQGKPRSHLFYDGPVKDHNFKNFELKLEVMTFPGANSGVYFHTVFQQGGWPGKGYEAQVDNTHSDPKRTGSLYNVKNYMEVPAKDNEWWTYLITYNNGKITTSVNGKLLVEYTEPENPGPSKPPSGTFCLQGHDPKSKVLFRNIRVKPLPD